MKFLFLILFSTFLFSFQSYGLPPKKQSIFSKVEDSKHINKKQNKEKIKDNNSLSEKNEEEVESGETISSLSSSSFDDNLLTEPTPKISIENSLTTL